MTTIASLLLTTAPGAMAVPGAPQGAAPSLANFLDLLTADAAPLVASGNAGRQDVAASGIDLPVVETEEEDAGDENALAWLATATGTPVPAPPVPIVAEPAPAAPAPVAIVRPVRPMGEVAAAPPAGKAPLSPPGDIAVASEDLPVPVADPSAAANARPVIAAQQNIATNARVADPVARTGPPAMIVAGRDGTSPLRADLALEDLVPGASPPVTVPYQHAGSAAVTQPIALVTPGRTPERAEPMMLDQTSAATIVARPAILNDAAPASGSPPAPAPIPTAPMPVGQDAAVHVAPQIDVAAAPVTSARSASPTVPDVTQTPPAAAVVPSSPVDVVAAADPAAPIAVLAGAPEDVSDVVVVVSPSFQSPAAAVSAVGDDASTILPANAVASTPPATTHVSAERTTRPVAAAQIDAPGVQPEAQPDIQAVPPIVIAPAAAVTVGSPVMLPAASPSAAPPSSSLPPTSPASPTLVSPVVPAAGAPARPIGAPALPLDQPFSPTTVAEVTTVVAVPAPDAVTPAVVEEVAAPPIDRVVSDARPPRARVEQSAVPRPDAVLAPAAGRVIASAARTFADAIHRAVTGEDRASPSTMAALATAAPAGAVTAAAVVPTGQAQQQTLDMNQTRWPEAMIQHIEKLRDMADANDMRIRVVPDALGAIDVSLKRDGDTIQVQLVAEQPQTRAMIAEAQPKLQEMAEARGLKLQQASGNGTPTGTAGQNAERNASQHNQQQQQRAAPVPHAPPSARRVEDDVADTDQRIA